MKTDNNDLELQKLAAQIGYMKAIKEVNSILLMCKKMAYTGLLSNPQETLKAVQCEVDVLLKLVDKFRIVDGIIEIEEL
jgi:5-bromo-4-chloroindolyl phosphate hydrolysis protein